MFVLWPGWPLDNFRRRFCHPSAWMAPRDLRMVAGARAWFSSVNGFNDWIDFQYYSSLKSAINEIFLCLLFVLMVPLIIRISRPFALLMWNQFWPDFGVRLVSCKVRGGSDQLSWWLEEETGVGMRSPLRWKAPWLVCLQLPVPDAELEFPKLQMHWMLIALWRIEGVLQENIGQSLWISVMQKANKRNLDPELEFISGCNP